MNSAETAKQRLHLILALDRFKCNDKRRNVSAAMLAKYWDCVTFESYKDKYYEYRAA